MRTFEGKVWVQKTWLTAPGMKEGLLKMADVKTKAQGQNHLRCFGAQNLELTKDERKAVIHCLHNLEACYVAAVKQKFAHRPVKIQIGVEP